MITRKLMRVLAIAGPAGILAAELCAAEIIHRNANRHPGECVILLHGLSRSALTMMPLECFLRLRGFEVLNLTYPSRRLSIEELGEHWLPNKLDTAAVREARRLHFVTHSMGGIVARQYVRAHGTNKVGRIVMLAPPNQGSEVAERLLQRGLLLKVFGPGGRELGVGPASVPRRMGAALVETGVVAANRSLNPLFSAWLPGPDDGRVTVASTRLQGMRAHITLRTTHSGILLRPTAFRAVLQFLENGRFESAPQDL